MNINFSYIIVGISSLCLWSMTTLAAEISSVSAKQRFPWNGKVDINYTVTGDIESEALSSGCFVVPRVHAVDSGTGARYDAKLVEGDFRLTEGTHHVVWHFDLDYPEVESASMVFTVSCKINPQYCVVDLSGGPEAELYPISYLDEEPVGGFCTTLYKTTNLVLRLIAPGSFIAGSDQTDLSHRMTITKAYYIGLFELTQKQYSLVMDENPSRYKVDNYPVDITYNALRGTSEGAKWPQSTGVDANSFFGKLSQRTGALFDLPTSAQWEYAIRAGTKTTYNYGDTFDGTYSWHSGNGGGKPHEVGLKPPCGYGLYDVYGNVWELCLDWYSTEESYENDRRGPTTGTTRVDMGGCFGSNDPILLGSYAHHGRGPGATSDYGEVGCRVIRWLVK